MVKSDRKGEFYMIGTGTIINACAILAGGLSGMLFGKLIKERHQQTLGMACGVSTLFIGGAGALSGMMTVADGSLTGGRSMFIVICMTVGALIGEILNIENWFERFGEWLKIKTGNARDNSFVDGFVTASLTVSIGAMAIVGSIQDGIYGDYSVLATKAVLDLIIVMVMTCSMGKGCIFSAIPVFVFQGTMTLMARALKPVMTDAALSNLSLIGNILIFCVGVNIVWGKKIRVANLLPGLVIAVILAFLPLGL